MASPADLARLNAQAVILSKMILIIFSAAFESYRLGETFTRNRNIGKALSEWIVSMSVRVNSAETNAPVPVAQIARTIGLPRPNVRRHLAQLAEHGVVQRYGDDGGYFTNPSYVQPRVPFFERMVEAVLEAADALRALP
jgi:DNA-binding transcriptional ArsR family regulator